MNLYDHLPTPDGALLTVVSFYRTTNEKWLDL